MIKNVRIKLSLVSADFIKQPGYIMFTSISQKGLYCLDKTPDLGYFFNGLEHYPFGSYGRSEGK